MRGFNLKLMGTATRTRRLFLHNGGMLYCVLYMFSVCGSLFGDVVQNENNNPKYGLDSGGAVDDSMTNFSDIWHSHVAMFQILMSNNWDDIMYTVGAGCGAASKVFFVISFIILPYVFGNIFTSIVLQSFDVHEHGPGELRCSSGLSYESPSAPRHGVLYILMPDDCCYKLQRRHNQKGFELHMDLMDSTKAELLEDCLTGDNMFRTVLTESEKEIVDGTARFKMRYVALIVLAGACLSMAVWASSLNSCTCDQDSNNC